jgi:hypothetical protein
MGAEEVEEGGRECCRCDRRAFYIKVSLEYIRLKKNSSRLTLVASPRFGGGVS